MGGALKSPGEEKINNCRESFLKPKNPPTFEVGPSQVEGPTGETSRVEPENTGVLMGFFAKKYGYRTG